MGNFFSLIGKKFLDKRLDFRVRLFNVLAMVGVLTSTMMAITVLFTDESRWIVLLNSLGAVFSVILLLYAERTGRYQTCYLLTIVAVFFGMFTVLFFSSGGYHGGMLLFFLFAISFTVFMLEGKMAITVTSIEILYYSALCFFAYLKPAYIQAYSHELSRFVDTLLCFVVTSLAIGIAMYMHFRLYNQQQRELEQARQRLADKNDALQQLDRLKTEFLGNISHELKTPLTVVSGYAQTSQIQLSGEENEAVRQKMRIIASEADRLALMVGQILDITRIEEGRMSMEKQPCHMDELIYNAVETHFPILNQRGNRLEIHCDMDLPQVDADPARVTQVLVNLISNALKHTADGVITLSARQQGQWLEVRVTDTGSGIPAEHLHQLFDRFHTGDGDTGTGLGLTICKHIIEQHGGEITAQSTVGEGSVFRFTLPLYS